MVISPSPMPQPGYAVMAPDVIDTQPLLASLQTPVGYEAPKFVEPTALQAPRVIAPQVSLQRQTYTLEQVQQLLDLERQRLQIINSV